MRGGGWSPEQGEESLLDTQEPPHPPLQPRVCPEATMPVMKEPEAVNNETAHLVLRQKASHARRLGAAPWAAHVGRDLAEKKVGVQPCPPPGLWARLLGHTALGLPRPSHGNEVPCALRWGASTPIQ